jgi:methionine-gamma-lyase
MRMRQHSENALKVARFLESHERVVQVRYPGLASHPQHEIARQQMSDFSGMLTFSLDCELLENFEFLKRLRIITHAVSLGHDQSLIFYLPTAFFFRDMVELPEAKQLAYWNLMGDGVFRFSVGIEDADDLIADLAQALESPGR